MFFSYYYSLFFYEPKFIFSISFCVEVYFNEKILFRIMAFFLFFTSFSEPSSIKFIIVPIRLLKLKEDYDPNNCSHRVPHRCNPYQHENNLQVLTLRSWQRHLCPVHRRTVRRLPLSHSARFLQCSLTRQL